MGKMSLKLDFSKPLNLGGLNLNVDKQTERGGTNEPL